MMEALRIFVLVVALVIVVMLNTVVVMWLERKTLGHLQSRMGPMRTGWHGLLQPFADALKLLGKEDLLPDGADRRMFMLAPIIAFVPSIMIYAATPFAEQIAGAPIDAGIFLVFGIVALFPVGVLVAGWSSHNKYALMGGVRSAAQQIAYEVPFVMSVLGIVMLSGSMRLTEIVSAQSPAWHLFTQPLAFLLFFIGMLADINRVPFDIPEAESELVAGFNIEYSSMRFALFFVAEYANVFGLSLLTALLFLGGWNGPGVETAPWLGVLWLGAKTYLVVFLVIWLRATLARVRVDQLMSLCWKLLLPASLVNLAITAVGVVVSIWLVVALQFAAAAAFVWIIARVGRTAGDGTRAAVLAAREASCSG